MSHLKHIDEFKKNLEELEILCPFKQQELTLEAYQRAIIMVHFKQGTSYFISEKDEDRYWSQLDKWNRVSPIKAQFIMQKVAAFMNSQRASLANRGVVLEEEPSLELPDGTKKCLCSIPSFNDLAQYLAKELRDCDE